MKSIIVTTLICIIIISCSTNEGFPQKWKMVKMAGQLPNSEKVGDEMEWQEFYLLNKDGSFTKNRDRDGIITEVSGVYTLLEEPNETFYVLTFNTTNDINGSCSQGVERLSLIDPTTIKGTWNICDGPGTEYELEGEG